MRMYILIRDDVPTGFALVAAAHGSLAAYLRFHETDEVRKWLSGPFFKTICRVTAEQFDAAKEAGLEHVAITESALGGQETALAFKPREEYPKAFRFFTLYN